MEFTCVRVSTICFMGVGSVAMNKSSIGPQDDFGHEAFIFCCAQILGRGHVMLPNVNFRLGLWHFIFKESVEEGEFNPMVAFNYGDYQKLNYCNKNGALSSTTNIDGSLCQTTQNEYVGLENHKYFISLIFVLVIYFINRKTFWGGFWRL